MNSIVRLNKQIIYESILQWEAQNNIQTVPHRKRSYIWFKYAQNRNYSYDEMCKEVSDLERYIMELHRMTMVIAFKDITNTHKRTQ